MKHLEESNKEASEEAEIEAELQQELLEAQRLSALSVDGASGPENKAVAAGPQLPAPELVVSILRFFTIFTLYLL